jgi:hypothetical protein
MTDAAETTAPTPDGEGLLVCVAPTVGPAVVDRVTVAAPSFVAGATASPAHP